MWAGILRDTLWQVLISDYENNAAETWKVDKETTHKLQTFINKLPRKILKIHWPDKISNIGLWNKTKQESVETTVTQRKWN
jgi:hypothetical protein